MNLAVWKNLSWKSLPSSLFQREESFAFGFDKRLLFSPLGKRKRGKEGDFKAFQMAKLSQP